MTEDEGKKYAKVCALLDSDQKGERQTALEMINELRVQHGWPKFADLLNSFSSAVPITQYRQMAKENATWIEMGDKLARENQILRASLRAVKGVKIAVAGLCVIVFFVGGYRLVWRGGETPPPPRSEATAPEAETGGIEFSRAMLAEMKRWQPWIMATTKEDGRDSEPTVHAVEGQTYWVIIRRDIEDKSHTDSSGRAFSRHCQHYFAERAAYDTVASPALYETPHPYQAGQMTWPKVASVCE
jgi:hypothetical protein